MKRVLFFVITLAVLAIFNGIVWQKEILIRDGRRIFLELVPVDPRSLMQGDYMRLGYALSNAVPGADSEDFALDGCLVVTLSAKHVADYGRLCDDTPLKSDEARLRYRKRTGFFATSLRVAPESFFFQEGLGAEFVQAKYAEVAVSDDGQAVLVNLVDGDFKAIRPRR